MPNSSLPVVTAHSAEEIASLLSLPTYRGRQIEGWAERGTTTFSEMTDLPARLREELPRRMRVFSSTVAEVRRSPDGTQKLLLTMEDGALVESVLIPDRRRLTLCMSSQVGCPVGCVFCASGMLGVTRSLAAHEIREQFLHAVRLAGEKRITNVVMMGMGEPLLNFDALVAALRKLPLSPRRITVSTVGLPDRIKRLAAEKLNVGLAVSLHAPDDETRNRIVPINRRFGIEAVVAAALDYFTETGRDVTFEYILIEGENASGEHADRLAALLHKSRHVNVNLIPMNPVEGLPYRPPSAEDVCAFRDRLEREGIPTHVRRPRGIEIDAACGQLRLRRISRPLTESR